jgi:Fic-DOC domain mobile mystery protein B
MMDPLLPTGDGHTELTEDDRIDLIPTYISTRGELYEAEQRNIADALIGKKPSAAQLLDDQYIRDLHRSMFGRVWKWAGQYRLRETNIGIAPKDIGPEVRKLIEDVKAWLDHVTYDTMEIVVRFHHRLVQIHPFPNGNGRLGRVAAEMLSVALGGPTLSWGSHLNLGTAELRERYIGALHAADDGDVSRLAEFALA